MGISHLHHPKEGFLYEDFLDKDVGVLGAGGGGGWLHFWLWHKSIHNFPWVVFGFEDLKSRDLKINC